MADVRVTSNADEVAEAMRSSAGELVGAVVAEIAEADALFREDLRGPSPGSTAGKTPFRIGNLLSTGRTQLGQEWISVGSSEQHRGGKDPVWQFVNDARPYSPSNAEQGDRVRIHGGRESYASFARFPGAPEGQYVADAGDAFKARFGAELEARAERALTALLDVS